MIMFKMYVWTSRDLEMMIDYSCSSLGNTTYGNRYN